MIERRAPVPHQIVIDPNLPPPITLFTTGPIYREWGFHHPSGWVPWEKHIEYRDGTSKRREGVSR